VQWGSAQCQLCGRFIADEDRQNAFRRSRDRIEPVDLKGKRPWGGVFCVCLECIGVVNASSKTGAK
jgi:hypothetical protein